MAEEIGWLIEIQSDLLSRPSGIGYEWLEWLRIKDGGFCWTVSGSLALRFSRKEDGENLLAHVHRYMLGFPRNEQLPGFRIGDIKPRVIEHGWNYHSANGS